MAPFNDPLVTLTAFFRRELKVLLSFAPPFLKTEGSVTCSGKPGAPVQYQSGKATFSFLTNIGDFLFIVLPVVAEGRVCWRQDSYPDSVWVSFSARAYSSLMFPPLLEDPWQVGLLTALHL